MLATHDRPVGLPLLIGNVFRHDAVKGLGRSALYGAMGALFLLHNYPRLQAGRGRFLGLPVSLTYHLAICVTAAVLLALLVRHAWPRHLDAAGEDTDADRGLSR